MLLKEKKEIARKLARQQYASGDGRNYSKEFYNFFEKHVGGYAGKHWQLIMKTYLRTWDNENSKNCVY